MKHAIGLLYVTTACVGFYWSLYLTFTGLYGVPFSGLYILIFVGAALLLLGAILWWASAKEWTRWFPIIGSTFLATYFVPAGAVLIRQGRIDAIRVVIVLLVLACLIVSVKRTAYDPISLTAVKESIRWRAAQTRENQRNPRRATCFPFLPIPTPRATSI